MVVWLKAGMAEIAFDDDIVPREAMCHLEHLESLGVRANEDASAVRARAEAEAADILLAAQAEYDALTAQAGRDASAVTRLGYAQGRRDALKHWHADASARRQAASAQYGSVRGRLADMVVQATASLMQGPALAQYLDMALLALDGLAEHDQTLSVTVHPDDRQAAHEAIERLRACWRDATVVKLIESAEVGPGTCICESGQAYVDGSLSLQLSALRLAALGELEGLQLPHDIVAAEPPPSPPGPPGPLSHPFAPDPASPMLPQGGRPGFDSPFGQYLGLGRDDEDPEGSHGEDDLDRLFGEDGLPGLPLPGGFGKPW